MRAQERPVFLNLLQIRLPIAGIMSILHRASGLLLFLLTPGLLFMLERSLSSPQGFSTVRDWLDAPLSLAGLFLLLWALSHHLLAGIRYLLLDIHIGVDRPYYRYSAWLVSVAAPLLALVLLGMLS